MCVCEVIEGKGRENWREKITPKTLKRPEAGRLLSTLLNAAAQWSKVHMYS